MVDKISCISAQNHAVFPFFSWFCYNENTLCLLRFKKDILLSLWIPGAVSEYPGAPDMHYIFSFHLRTDCYGSQNRLPELQPYRTCGQLILPEMRLSHQWWWENSSCHSSRLFSIPSHRNSAAGKIPDQSCAGTGWIRHNIWRYRPEAADAYCDKGIFSQTGRRKIFRKYV